MKKTPGEILKDYVPQRPKPFYAKLFRAVLFFASFGKKPAYRYFFDKKEMRGKQVMLLADHASTDSYIFAIRGYPFIEPNVVMGYHNIQVRGLFKILLNVGVIPKRLYTPDVSAVRSMLRLKKEGASFVLFPEGIQSMAGTTMPTDPAAMGLVKKLGLTTVLCRGYGAYLNRPRFDSSYRKGPMEFTYEVLFTEDELKELSESELYARYLEKFRYNDFAWNREKGFSYRGKHPNAYGLDRILYICPHCFGEFTLSVEGEDIVCECGNRVHVDECYSLTPCEGSELPFNGIDEWFAYQRAVVRGEIMMEDFSLSYDAEYLTLDETRLGSDLTLRLGEGRVTIDREGLTYDGTKDGENVSFTIPISAIPSAPFVSGTANEFFVGRDYYRFVPKGGGRLPVKVLLVIEELHNLKDEARRRVSSDAYGNEIIVSEKTDERKEGN